MDIPRPIQLLHDLKRRTKTTMNAIVAVALLSIGWQMSGWTPAFAQGLELNPAPATAEPEDEAEPEKISTTAGPEQDQAIERRLEDIFANIEGLERIRIDVRAGVVSLTGEALSSEAREQAVEFARQVDGVVEVKDDMQEVRNIEQRLAPTWEKLRDYGYDFIGYLPLLAVAGLVLFGFWLLARWVTTWDFIFKRSTRSTFLGDLLRQLVRMVILLIGAVIALDMLGASAVVGTALGAAGLVGIAVGFALRDTVENYITSVLLSIRQPFAPNDWVQIEGFEGYVTRLTSRATILLTLEGNHVRIPNASVFKGIIVNYSRNPKRRFDFTVGIGTRENLLTAQQLVVKRLLQTEGILDRPPPLCLVETLGDFNVILRVMAWVDQRQADYFKVRSEALRLVKQALDSAGITMPEPIYNVHLTRRGDGDAVPELTSLPQARQKTAASEPKVTMDISRNTYLDQQVAEDAAAGKSNLLSTEAPRE